LFNNNEALMKNTKELLGARIKEIRKIRRLSQYQLSEKVNIDPKHLSRIEVGKSYTSLETLEKIAMALQVEIKDLFEFVDHVTNEEIRENTIRLLNEANEKKLKIIFNFTKGIIYSK